MEKNRTRICGSTEDRINRFMRMCLEWQYDLFNKTVKPSSFYFKKYHVGKYKRIHFSDLCNVVVDREYCIRKMNSISSERQTYDRTKGKESGKVIIKQMYTPYNDFSVNKKGVKIEDNSTVRFVAKSKKKKECYNLTEVPLDIVVKYLRKNGYVVIKEEKLLNESKL